jgi:hypothetical protein
MFDLEQAIAEWRKQMLAAGIRTPVPLEELEIHLREEIAEQKKSGIREPKAFESAVQRIGRTDEIQAEFQKTEAEARHKRLLGRFILAYWLMFYSSLQLMGIHAFLKSDMSPAWRLAGWIDIVLFVVVIASILSWRWSQGILQQIPYKRTRTAIRIAFGCIVPAVFFCLKEYVLPGSDFADEQKFVLLLWLWTVTLPLAVIYLGLGDAAKQKRTA